MFASKDVFLTPPSGGYTIGKSVRLRSSASAYFNRTPSSASNRRTWTWSGWVKRGLLATDSMLFSAANGGARDYICFYGGAQLTLDLRDSFDGQKTTTQVFRDPSAWYHIVVVLDTTQATANNRITMYVNGVQITSFANNSAPSQNYDGSVNNTVLHTTGKAASSGAAYLDGYLTEVNFIDGQALTPSSFGSTNALTGVWQPAKYTGTYGTNGFYLNFSSNGSSAALGTDFSGNSNTWTVNNISVTAGTTYDSMVDSPTVSATSSNYCVLNPLEKYSGLTIADGNLKVTASDNTQYGAAGTFAINSGKWYYEAIFSVASVNNQAMGFVTTNNNVQTAQWAGSTGMFMCGNFISGTAIYVGVNGSYTQVSTTLPSAGSYLVCAIDYDNGKAWFGTTTSSGGAVTYYPATTGGTVGDPTAGTNPTITFSTTYPVRPFMGSYGSGANWIANFGQRPFITTAPTGYNAWNTYNLPTSTITNGAAYMAATTYTGNNTAGRSITGVGFQPDLVWIKSRAVAHSHIWDDSVRGAGKFITSNTTTAEQTDTNVFTSFNSDGFTVGNDATTNGTSSETYVAWSWKAGTTSASNTNGSITSTVSVGATQGFSVVTYTGNGTPNATVGHGLGVTPAMIIVKSRNRGTYGWNSWHQNLTPGYYIALNYAATQDNSVSIFPSGGVTSTVWNTGGDSLYNNQSTITYVAYCFAAVAGYSAFGSYTGNGAADGPFIYTGFRPRFVLYKSATSASVGDWRIHDTSRSTYNVAQLELYAQSFSSEPPSSNAQADILSNGFKLRGVSGNTSWNESGVTYIYAAFAENPFKNSLAR